MDDAALQAILDTLPPKPVRRSKLEPYARLITELRRRNRSYREITQVLVERCGLSVGVHTVYNFVRVRSQHPEPTRRTARRRGANAVAVAASPSVGAAAVESGTAHPAAGLVPSNTRARRGAEKVFHYDENEPLRLLPPESTRK